MSALAKKIREIYLSLPDTKETPTWGSPHFRVGEKIFGGFDEEDGRTIIGFKLEMEHAAAMIASDRRFARAPYVGHKGWVKMDVTGVKDWEEVRTLVQESYRLIAPKRLVAQLNGQSVRVASSHSASKKAPKRTPPAKKAPAKKTPAKKTPAKKKAATKLRTRSS
jgi:predicted DNA-binding protein (MmcQ/YjbR family)